MALDYPYQEWAPDILWTYITVEIVTILVLFIISGLFWRKYFEKHSHEVQLLGILTSCMAISFLLGLIPQILSLTAPDLPIINGIPVFYQDRRLWWTNIAYVFISISNLCLFKFNQAIFRKPSQKTLRFYLILVIIFNIWSFYHGIFVVEPGVPSLTLPLSIMFLLLQFYVWGFLFFHAYRDYRRVEPSMYREGLKMIVFSALCMIFSFITYVINVLLKTQVITILNFAFYNFTVFLIYLGYILPPWYRQRLMKRYPPATEN